MNRYLMERMRGSDDRDGRQGVKGTGRYGIGGSRYYGRRGDRAEDGYDYARGEDYQDSANSRMRSGTRRSGQPYDRPGNTARQSRYDRRDMGYDDYSHHSEFEYNEDAPMELTGKEIRKWEHRLENADGSHGAKFTKDQIVPMAKQYGIKFDKITEDEFTMTVNMMYADYCMALQEASMPNYSRPEPYIHLAKAFLFDEDFEGEPYEKLALYYCAIVEYDN